MLQSFSYYCHERRRRRCRRFLVVAKEAVAFAVTMTSHQEWTTNASLWDNNNLRRHF
jgi:hypothetical protein